MFTVYNASSMDADTFRRGGDVVVKKLKIDPKTPHISDEILSNLVIDIPTIGAIRLFYEGALVAELKACEAHLYDRKIIAGLGGAILAIVNYSPSDNHSEAWLYSYDGRYRHFGAYPEQVGYVNR